MRASLSIRLAMYLFMTSLQTINAITLNQWQPITGFSQACVDAYNTPLQGCTASDFEQGSCSTTCIAFLEALSKILSAECEGTSAAYPNTLIGSFFKGEGTSAICPNVLVGSGNNNHAVTIGVGEASTYALNPDTSTAKTIPSSLATATLPLLSAASTSPTPRTTSNSGSASAAATTTLLAVINTTVAPKAPPSAASASSAGRPHAQGSSTSTSSTGTATAGGDNNGGGSPLDVGSSSSSNHNVGIEGWVLGLLIGSVGLVLFI